MYQNKFQSIRYQLCVNIFINILDLKHRVEILLNFNYQLVDIFVLDLDRSPQIRWTVSEIKDDVQFEFSFVFVSKSSEWIY